MLVCRLNWTPPALTMENHRMTKLRPLVLAVAILLMTAGPGLAQSASDEWKVVLYPIYAWVPLGLDIDVDVAPLPDGGGGGGGGKIVDSRFDGAYFGGLSVTGPRFRVDADGLWAAVGGDRPENPFLEVDVDAIYFHVTGGVRVVDDLYVTAGVRRLALKYNVRIGDQPDFERKPGLWDPLVGLAWHRVGEKLEVHVIGEGGGFGVGTDVELSGGVRLDWKPFTHFGFTGGYNFMYVKLSNTRDRREFTVKQTMHGPALGIGIYF
jgi:hypothetical protein